jgi:hypothetical protein
MTLTDAERWELACWDERVKNAQIVLGIMEGERANAQARIAAAHADDETPAAPDRAQE